MRYHPVLPSLLLSSLVSAVPNPVASSPASSAFVSSSVVPSGSAPFTPSGGLLANFTPPVYKTLSDFDFQSLNLGLHQEYIELDLFHHGLAQFSDEEFDAAGIDAEDRYLIQYMAEQEIGHATALTNMIGANATKPCTYRYPFTTVREFIDFNVKVTRWGEAGVYGFLEQLNSRPAAQIVLQSITVEARQQMAFRQFEGLFPMPFWHTTGITQSMQWTLLAPYIVSCPAENPHLIWQNFPALNITNNPSAVPLVNSTEFGNSTLADITNNRTIPLSAPGRQLNLTWELPGKTVGPNNSYTTNTTAGEPKFVAWFSQLNTTYTLLENINGTTGTTIQPGGNIFGNDTAPIINGTVFVAITDSDIFVTPFNLSEVNPHIVAGPALYTSG
ncbi:Rds1 protein [Crucibulum laeve]|uniref:Rds1 protein n=1 Tax=Crucibulum laeve TaxID=68775 RepID=A0A5C3LLE4_9AGAR|nr:Rds1 protein [Crucibulum laeve]